MAAIERGRNFTRVSRLVPWLALLDVDVDDFVSRYHEVIAPEAGEFAMSTALRREAAADAAARRSLASSARPAPPRDVIASRQAALGAALWQRRASKGLTRRQVAEAAGIDQARLRSIERGLLRHRPHASLLWGLIAALGSSRIWGYELAKKYEGAITPDKPGLPVGEPVGPIGGAPRRAEDKSSEEGG